MILLLIGIFLLSVPTFIAIITDAKGMLLAPSTWYVWGMASGILGTFFISLSYILQ